MEEGVRSGGSSGVVVKNRSSSGCLIVRRKGDALAGELGSSGSRKVYVSKKEKKRRRLALSDSGSSDEPSASRRRVGPETIRVCNDLTAYGKGVVEESERKRDRLEGIQYSGDDYFGKNCLDMSERKRSKLDVFEFDEYDSTEGERMHNLYYDETGVAFGRRFSGSLHVGRSGAERDFEAGSSRHGIDKRKNAYFERMSSMNRGNQTGRFEMNRQESFVRDKFAGHPDQAIRLQGKNGVLKVLVNKKKGIGVPLAKFKHQPEEHLKVPRMEETVKKNVLTPFHSEEKIVEKPGSAVKTGKRHMSLRKSLPSKNSKSFNWDSDNSDTSLKQEPENVTAVQSSKRVSLEGEDTPCSEKTLANKIKEGRVRRGSGTEKQKLREKIRGLLVDAGWTIDYRPRRNRDYLDAVYINPAGTAYWSIIKAYDALQKQLNDEDTEIKPSTDGSTVRLIADEDLCQLTRKTRKKIETEMKMKQRDGSDSENAKEVCVRRSTTKKHDSDSMDSASHDEKLSSFIKQGGKSFKSRINENGFATLMPNGRNLHDTVERAASGSNSHMLHGRKSKKLGRCTLLIRSSNKGQNSEMDGFVPYTGKRTVLTWLIESGVVQLSQKVQYKNRRRTRVMLEGWITRDGIHCGCCSKILTISKFELHAGSKLRQPYQNIFLESGISLTQCQIDAWNRQVGSEHLGFHSVNSDGDDPNDDTCGICGDGGDLICCDGCPSTFHQSCLDIEMLPPGDWHCPNCTCKFCEIATETVDEEDDTVPLLSCSLCEKKYHESCAEDICASSVDSSAADPPFCGQKCKELFEHLQKYVGVKHDLEGGFSWSLTHRTDDDSKITCNSRLAVAMAVMDECFLPIVDRRSGINIIHNVLYNCGSNFNRLNYGGFYSAILERGDEIISAASIRFHGTKLAEMPFIGTRHIYRCQGMCRRLFSAIESALCSFKVEKLIIPAISELTHTWTEVFGFTPLEEALKHEMRSMNMLVFPGIDMLQKILGEQEHEVNNTPGRGTKKMEHGHKQYSKPELAAKSDIDLSTRSDLQGCDDTDPNHVNEKTEVVAAAETKSGTQHVDVPNHTIVTNDSLNAPPKPKDQDPDNETALSDTPDEAKISVTMSDCKNRSPTKMSPVGATTEVAVLNEPVPDGPDPVLEDNPLPGLVLVDKPLLRTALEDEPMSDCALEDEPISDRALEDEPISDRALEDEPLSDRALEDEPLSDRALEDEPLSDPALEDVAVTSVSLDTSLELENTDHINYCTMCLDSPPRAKSSETSSNSVSHDNVATENKPSTDSVLEDKSEA